MGFAVAAVAVSFVLVVVVAVAIVLFVVKKLGKPPGRWMQLAQRYPGPAVRPATAQTGGFMYFDGTRYQNMFKVARLPEGLYLERIAIPLAGPPLPTVLIPWEALERVEPGVTLPVMLTDQWAAVVADGITIKLGASFLRTPAVAAE